MLWKRESFDYADLEIALLTSFNLKYNLMKFSNDLINNSRNKKEYSFIIMMLNLSKLSKIDHLKIYKFGYIFGCTYLFEL